METTITIEVQEIVWPEKIFLIKRDTIAFDKLSFFFKDAYGQLYGSLQQREIQSNEAPFAIYYSIDEGKKETDVAAAISIQGQIQEIEGFQLLTIPQSKVLTTNYVGPYEEMDPAYQTLEKYMAEHDYKKEWMIEQYFTSPSTEPDPYKWETAIYFIIK